MKRIFVWFLSPASALYIFLSLIYPTDPDTIARRGLSTGEARVIALSVAVPLIAIWFLAFIATWRFKDYARTIRKHPDGVGLMMLATGMQLLAVYFPVRSLTKISLNLLAYHHPSFTTISNLLITYINIIFPLVVYVLIGHAAFKLLELANVRLPLRVRYIILSFFALISVIFCYAACSNESLSPSDWLTITDFYGSTPIRLLTIVAPYLFMWYVGILAAADIYTYQRSVKGIFYRQSLKLLSVGLTIEIIASIASQYTTAIASTLIKLSTSLVLSIAYIVLIFTVVGFILIYKGVNKLKKLEEI